MLPKGLKYTVDNFGNLSRIAGHTLVELVITCDWRERGLDSCMDNFGNLCAFRVTHQSHNSYFEGSVTHRLATFLMKCGTSVLQQARYVNGNYKLSPVQWKQHWLVWWALIFSYGSGDTEKHVKLVWKDARLSTECRASMLGHNDNFPRLKYLLYYLVFPLFVQLRPMQTDPTLLANNTQQPNCWAQQCCDLLRPFAWSHNNVGTCWHLLRIVWNRSNFLAHANGRNIDGQQHTTMLGVVGTCCFRMHGPLDARMIFPYNFLKQKWLFRN